MQVPGVVAFVSAKDIPGDNCIRTGPQEASLFAPSRVEFVVQPIGVVVAETLGAARLAASRVAVTYSHPKVGPCPD